MAKQRTANSSEDGPKQPADLRALRQFRDVSDDDLSLLFAKLKHHPVKTHATLHVHSNFDGEVGFIWRGHHRVIGISESGVAVTISTLIPGDCFGLVPATLKLQTSERLRLVSDSAGLILHMAGDDLLAASQISKPLCNAVIGELAKIAQTFGARMFELAALNVRNRIELELLRLSRNGDWSNGVCTLNNAPTHAVLATQIGATREAVSRHLRALAKEGVLKVRRGIIKITKPEHFKAVANAGVSQLFLFPGIDTPA